MAEAEPAPAFRRFPWTQLVFCIACLSMAVWTWMRYSHAWPVGLHELDVDATTPEGRWFRDRYVTFEGAVLPERAGHFWVWLPELPSDDTEEVTAVDCTGPHCGQGKGPKRRFLGRAGIRERYLNPLVHRVSCAIVVDCSASRWTGASVGGLVVGAMGWFIFGLYLRRWLVDRRALRVNQGGI